MGAKGSIVILEIKGTPVAWQRAGRNGKRSFTPMKTKAAEERIKGEYILCGARMLEGPIEAVFEFIYEPPRSWSNRKRLMAIGQPKITRPDNDNLAKLCQDALNGVAYTDDSQIYKILINKVYGEEAKTIIRLKEVDEIG